LAAERRLGSSSYPFCPALSFTMKQAPLSSTDQGGRKRRV
jgi:hypothetical protein